MKSPPIHPLALLCLSALLNFTSLAQISQKTAQSTGAKLDIAQLKAVPDGNYLVTLELNGKQERLNLKVQGNRAKCMNSSDPMLKDIVGQFQFLENGSFGARFQGRTYRASQLWIFRTDGAAAIREAPDRGEQQSAVPVTGDSIELPKTK